MSRTRKHKVDVDGRECTSCEEYKLWDEYYAGAGAHGKDTRCKDCMRGKTRARNKLPEVRAADRARWSSRPPREPVLQQERRLRQLFGITPEERKLLDERAVFGAGLCDLHGGPETLIYARYGKNQVRGLSIDHAHDCGRHLPEKGCRYCIRGLLCCECNRTIIRLAEKYPELAKRFADYLARRPLLAV